MNSSLIVKRVPFMGAELMAAKDDLNQIWAGVSFLCNGMGMNKNEKDRQIKNIQADTVLSGGCVKFDAGVFDHNNSTLALKLEYVPLWPAKISITPAMRKDKPELAEKLVAYQLKAKDALAAAFINPVRPMSTAQMLLAQAQWNVEQESRLAAIEAKSEAMTEKLEKAVTVFALPTVEIEAWRGEMNKHISTLCETYELNYCKFRGETYQELEKIAGVNLSSRQTRMKSRMRKAGAKYADCAAVSKLHVIAQDKRLRPIYEGIIRREEARLLVCKAPA